MKDAGKTPGDSKGGIGITGTGMAGNWRGSAALLAD
jgi:hypothetical protein